MKTYLNNTLHSFFRVSATTASTDIQSITETSKKSLITEPVEANCFVIKLSDTDRSLKPNTDYLQSRTNDSAPSASVIANKVSIDRKGHALARTDRELQAEIWTRTYLQAIGSPGVIHSINTGRNGRLILCNVREMNTCNEVHEDYFNDTTVYMNLDEKQSSIRCNRPPCTRKPWKWQRMNK